MTDIPLNTQTSYDAVSTEYARRFQDEMDHKPFDRQCLERLAREAAQLGPICDMGCGPGQIARYLHKRGLAVLGVDLSPGMIAEAKRINPDIPFHQADMLDLPFEDNTWGGIAAFYCIIHVPHDDVVAALHEMRRVLKPGGVLLVAFHVGEQVIHMDEWWDKKVNLNFVFYQPPQMERWLAAAGYKLEETLIREPNPDVEYASRRAYLFARKPLPM